jgi:hypothetical protein
MPQVNINGVPIQYPATGDVEWGDEATEFAIQVGAVLQKIGQGNQTPTTNNIVIGSISSPGNLTVASGNTDLGGTLDVTGVTTIVDDLIVDTDTLFVDVSTDRVGINTTTPTEALDVTGKVLVSSDITVGGVIVADDSTSTSAPPITFTGDLNTGIGRSGADTLDLVTGGQSRFRVESTGQIKAVYESQVGTDYNTQLDNGYLCRAWVNFNGTGTVAIRASGNVSSITDNGTGDYIVNFTNAMPDANYCANVTPKWDDIASFVYGLLRSAQTATALRVIIGNTSGNTQDSSNVCVAVFR